jgi:co-chaperonin GroES (HSP10)
MNVVKGKLKPLRDNVLVTDMNFEEQTTASGIIIQSDDGKSHGVKSRWARVWAIGPEQQDVKVGEWIYIDHGRWTRGIKVEDNGQEIVIRRVETSSILLLNAAISTPYIILITISKFLNYMYLLRKLLLN